MGRILCILHAQYCPEKHRRLMGSQWAVIASNTTSRVEGPQLRGGCMISLRKAWDPTSQGSLI